MMLKDLKDFFQEHPTILLTICYFIVTLIGIIYSYFFYQEFSINIIQFADLSDFLLVSILEPLAILVFIGIIIFSFSMFMFDLWTRKKFPAYGRFVESRLKAKFTDPLGITLLLGVFTVFVVKSLAIENATLVKSASADQFMVSFTGSTGQPQQLALNLLGTTSRYTYFYDPSKNQSIIIPVENVALMQKFSSSTQTLEVKK